MSKIKGLREIKARDFFGFPGVVLYPIFYPFGALIASMIIREEEVNSPIDILLASIVLLELVGATFFLAYTAKEERRNQEEKERLNRLYSGKKGKQNES